jgi:hypothetical protein
MVYKLTMPVVTLAEVASKVVAGGSVASSIRPRRYYKIPKETLEATLDDVEQLINFFVIESQRVVFAENVLVTSAVSRMLFRVQHNADNYRSLLLPSSHTTWSSFCRSGAWLCSLPRLCSSHP